MVEPFLVVIIFAMHQPHCLNQLARKVYKIHRTNYLEQPKHYYAGLLTTGLLWCI